MEIELAFFIMLLVSQDVGMYQFLRRGNKGKRKTKKKPNAMHLRFKLPRIVPIKSQQNDFANIRFD